MGDPPFSRPLSLREQFMELQEELVGCIDMSHGIGNFFMRHSHPLVLVLKVPIGMILSSEGAVRFGNFVVGGTDRATQNVGVFHHNVHPQFLENNTIDLGRYSPAAKVTLEQDQAI